VGLDLTVATTAKRRHARVEYAPVARLPELLEVKGTSVNSTGIVFGREESGLTNDEIRLCDVVSRVQLAQPYPSLNLGQAVMIYAYTLSEYASDEAVSNKEIPDKEGFRALMDRLRLVLAELGMDQNPTLYNRLLERLAWLGEDDIHLVHSVLNRYMSLREGN
jgi:tRNA/rRNA methyltransferase